MAAKLFELSDEYAEVFLNNGLDSFESVWAVDAEIVDEPNINRGGHSDVGLLRLPRTDGSDQCFYLKRQTNHNCHTLSHPFHGIPLAVREWQNIRKLNEAGIKTVDVACVGRVQNDGDRCILVTKALDNYQSLREWLSQSPDAERRDELMAMLGRLVGQMHSVGLKHSCLYAKHVFVSKDAPLVIRFIDLEKAKPFFTKRGGLKDVETFFRRTRQLTPKDKQQFLGGYVPESPISQLSPTAQQKVVEKMMLVEYS